AIIRACSPEIVFTHNLADKHDTHVGVTLRVLEALRSLPVEARPRKVYSLEVWRGLDWLADEAKAVFDTAAYPDLAEQILAVFASQCAGGKRYDLAATGRRLANATFFASHEVDASDSCAYGLDITELMYDKDPAAFIAGHIEAFREDVVNRIAKMI
ncbi:MAG: PIG-L family deacetylase, partial [Lachnospiraceae bacterium]|nr:PIG-L family deacetylase [Lachnospiraceae bacterium]